MKKNFLISLLGIVALVATFVACSDSPNFGERERKTKSGKIIKVAGCSPIHEGVLLIKLDTTLEDVRRFGEECQQRWGITPLQIFLHKDEGHWLGGEPTQTTKRVFRSVANGLSPTTTPISYLIGWTTIRARAESSMMMI